MFKKICLISEKRDFYKNNYKQIAPVLLADDLALTTALAAHGLHLLHHAGTQLLVLHDKATAVACLAALGCASLAT